MLGGETILDGEAKEIKVGPLWKTKRQSTATPPDMTFSLFSFKDKELLLSLSLSLSL
ncbi:MAG: hypothetical protein V2A53_05240 [bacterium]